MPRIAFIFVIALLFAPLHAGADTINACANKTNGNLRLVADPGQCKNNEAPISWESEGPEGPQGPPGEATCGTSSFQLVGFTAATVSRGNGVFALTATCQSEFPGSRLCTSSEVMTTIDIPDLSGAGTAEAWILPDVRGAGTTTSSVDAVALTTSTSSLTCVSFSNTAGGGGLAVDIDGKFFTRNCDIVLSVGCCAPVGGNQS